MRQHLTLYAHDKADESENKKCALQSFSAISEAVTNVRRRHETEHKGLDYVVYELESLTLSPRGHARKK